MDNLNTDALNQAVKCIMRRDMSRAELQEKLKSKGFDECAIRNTIAYLIEKNWYSEEKAARELTEAKMRHAHVGPEHISRFLHGKRFDPQVIEQTVDNLFNRYSEKELALDNARKKLSNLRKKYSNDQAKTGKIGMALRQFLAQRGFSESICEDVVQTVMSEE